MDKDDPEPTGYCLSCGAALLSGLRWCGAKCLSEWAGLGAAYAVSGQDGITVTETDKDGRAIRAWFTRHP